MYNLKASQFILIIQLVFINDVKKTTQEQKKLIEVQDTFNDLQDKSVDSIKPYVNILKDIAPADRAAMLARSALTTTEAESILMKTGLTGAALENAMATYYSTAATNADSVAKTGNLTITELLKAAWQKLNAVITKNPVVFALTAIVAVVTAAIAIFKHFNESFEEAQQKAENSRKEYENLKSELNSLNSELQTTNDRIDELNEKDSLSFLEQEELAKLQKQNEFLEKQIALKAELTRAAGEKAAEDAVNAANKKGSDWDKDSTRFESAEKRKDYIANLNEAIEEYKSAQDSLDKTSPDYDFNYTDYQTSIDKCTDSIETFKNEIMQITSELSNELAVAMDEFGNPINEASAETVANLNSLYDMCAEWSAPEIKMPSVQETISGILEKNMFEGVNEALTELAKNGELSITTLSAQFPGLINYLEQAGISAKDLMNYILLASGIQPIDYSSAARQLMTTVGISQEGVNTAADQQTYRQLTNAGAMSNEGLEAYLTVKTQFTDGQIANWTTADWISKIQMEMDAASPTLNAEASFDSEHFSDLESQLSSIQSAYDTVTGAMEEYSEQGSLSMETIDSLLALDDAYINALVNENGELEYNEEAFANLARIKIEEAKASVYQEACMELTRIKALDTKLAADELALANGTLTESAYKAAEALYQEVVAMGGANAELAQNVWDTAAKKVSLLDSQLEKVSNTAGTFGESSRASASSAADAVKDAFNTEKENLDYLRKAELITDTDYYNRLSGLNETYFKNSKAHAKDYRDYALECHQGLEQIYKESLESQKSDMDKVISVVQKRLDKEIKSYEKQQDAIRAKYETEINAVQSQIDALSQQKAELQSVNDEKQIQFDLEQKLYNLSRAQNQRTNKVFNGEQFVYEADSTAIRNASRELEDAQLKQTIYEINQTQAHLEESKKSLETALDQEIETLNAEIGKLKEYKEQWAEVSTAYEDSQNELLAAQLLGQDWESRILNDRITTLQDFRDEYIRIQNEIASANKAIAEQSQTPLTADTAGTPKGSDPETPPKEIIGYYIADANGKQISPIYSTRSEAESKRGITGGAGTKEVVPLVKKYARGVRNLNESQLAWTQENGSELIISPSSGAVLTPLSQGDSVLKSTFTENLFKWAQLNPGLLTGQIAASLIIPSITSAASGTPQSITQNISLTLPNVTNNGGVDNLIHELNQLKLNALQYSHRRNG